MWTEKYRPETLDEVVGHDAAVTRFQKFLDGGSGGGIPHVILAGKPGIGKTATIVSFARDLYGDEWRQNFREFNASDDRGIDVIRDDVKPWCRKSVSGDYPYKIVFLDEADQLTRDAQPALRRIMEQYSDTTRFALSCNYSNEIIGPLQSRCATMHFKPLSEDEVMEVLNRVVEGEGIEVENEATLEKIAAVSRGRARDAIVTLQTAVMEGKLEEEQVDLVTAVVDDGLVEEILTLALDGEVDTAQQRLAVEIIKEGADPHQLVGSVHRVLHKLDLPPDYRAKSFELLATIEERIHMGLNPHVQFDALLGHLYMSQGLSAMAQQGEGDV